jgi:putative spermidine/putrescine transport system substrate-binding protein
MNRLVVALMVLALAVGTAAGHGVTFGIQARKEGVVAPYKPAFWNEIPDGLKDPEGHWFTIHSGTLGLFVNVDALGGKPVPKGWKDLLKPEHRGMVGYLDPTSAFVGYVGAVAINQALGGSFEDFTPAINYFKELQRNAPIVPKQTSYARVVSGEIPILMDYDFNAYRGKYKDKANVAFVIPSEGTVIVPYVMSLVKSGPNPEGAKKVLDHLMSDKGQAVWANAFLRPVRAKAMSKEAQDKFLPAGEYARAKTIDYARMAQSQDAFAKRFQQEVR